MKFKNVGLKCSFGRASQISNTILVFLAFKQYLSSQFLWSRHQKPTWRKPPVWSVIYLIFWTLNKYEILRWAT